MTSYFYIIIIGYHIIIIMQVLFIPEKLVIDSEILRLATCARFQPMPEATADIAG